MRLFHGQIPQGGTFNETGGQGRAVDLYQHTFFPAAQIVNGARNQLFPRAGFAEDENAGVRGRDGLHSLQHFFNRLASPDNLLEVVLGFDLFLQVNAFLLQPRLELSDLFISLHVLNGKSDLLRNLLQKFGVTLRILIGREAREIQHANHFSPGNQGKHDV